MDRQIASRILKAYGRPIIKTSNKIYTFARQDNDDIKRIESMKEDELIKQWKSLVWLNSIYGQVSLNELQRIDLIELEMDQRKFHENGVGDELIKWLEDAHKKFNHSLEKENQ